MKNISYEQIIAILGMSIWFIFPLGLFFSVIKQDREALPSPRESAKDKQEKQDKKDKKNKKEKQESLKIFEHKKMVYNDESEESEIAENDAIDNSGNPLLDDDFIHPHSGIGSEHVHHIH